MAILLNPFIFHNSSKQFFCLSHLKLELPIELSLKQMIKFYPLRNVLELGEHEILNGHSLSESLSQHKLFDDKMIAQVKVVEETNKTVYI